MLNFAGTRNAPQLNTQLMARICLVVVAILAAMISGCTNLRLPAIDPTGQRIFAPLPQTTGVALPGSAGEGIGCLRRLTGGLRAPSFALPTPVFTDPAEPPACLVPETAAVPVTAPPAIASTEPCVPSEPCSEECGVGPPAVLYGRECQIRNVLTLPKRGKRGCILLTPQKIVAPVGGEVVLKSGICGTDGYLQVGEPLEWMLTPDSVGTLIQVGDDSPGLLHRLARVSKAEKKDGSYARGVTSTKRTLITRGNLNREDDVQLEKGQTWVTLSSPSEGTSRVTVLAPESDCWDNRKATATIYWVDARWQYPSAQIVAADVPVSLTTRVTRSEGRIPAAGWKVRYELLNPEVALFPNGSPVIEVPVDSDGNATAQAVPFKGKAGITPVDIQVIRPGGATDNIPNLTLSRGQTFVTWSAPQLSIEAGAPPVASFNQPVEVYASVKNAGDQPATNVRVVMGIPEGVTATSRDTFAQNTPRAIEWRIDELPPQTQIDLVATVTSKVPARLDFEARADGDLISRDQVVIDVYRPSLSIDVNTDRDRYETGDPVTFKVLVENTGERALEDVSIEAIGNSNMVHQGGNGSAVGKKKNDGPLQPGETWPVQVTFVPTDSGRQCVNFTAKSSAGQQAQRESCVTVINPVPPTPAVTVRLDRRQNVKIGPEPAVLRGRVENTGEVALTDLRVTMTHDPQLLLLGATEQDLDKSRLGQYLIAWNIPLLAPGESRLLEARVRGLQPNPRSQVIMTAKAAEGAGSTDSYTFEIEQGDAPVSGPPPGRQPSTSPGASPVAPPFSPPSSSDNRTPELPPTRPIPTIPPGAAPIPSPDNDARPLPTAPDRNLGGGTPAIPGSPRATATPNPIRSNQLLLDLASQTNPVRVGDPIRYTLRVTNDRDVADSQVSMRFRLPPGTRLRRVTQTGRPEEGRWQVNQDVIELADIGSMNPGETIYYTLVMESNQPQTYNLLVEAASQQSNRVISASTETTVVP